MSTDLAPCQDDLGRGSALLLRNCLNLWSRNEQRYVEEVVAEGGIGGDVDVLLLGVGDELVAGKDRVTLDLVDGGDDAGLVNEFLERLGSEVGDTRGASLALGQRVNRLPCLAVGNRVIDVDLVGI